MIPHGYKKLQHLLEHGLDASFSNPLGLGAFPTLILAILAELVCPVLIILGWQVRWMSVLPLVTMLSAAFLVHLDDPWAKMELPLLFSTGFAAIILLGPGRYALGRKKSRSRFG